MKKILPWLLMATLILMSTSCISTDLDADAPLVPTADHDRETLNIYIDGQPLNDSGYEYSDVKQLMSGEKIDGKYYYGVYLSHIANENLATVEGAFMESDDGFVSYLPGIDKLFLAAYSEENGEYISVDLNGKHSYGSIMEGSDLNKGVTNVYLVSVPADFKVEIQKNGQKIGELAMDDFMKSTPVNGDQVPTEMFDGSFMYEGGASTYEGRFLGISYETMLAKLKSLDLDLSGDIVDVEYYGTTGAGKEGKNEEYSTMEEDPKYFGRVDFFCMFDGMTTNEITTGNPIGLTAFINGTGGRWMTHNLATINFIIETNLLTLRDEQAQKVLDGWYERVGDEPDL